MRTAHLSKAARCLTAGTAALLVPALVAPALATGAPRPAAGVSGLGGAELTSPVALASPAATVEQPTTSDVPLSGIDDSVNAPDPTGDGHDHDHDHVDDHAEGNLGAMSTEETLTLALAAKVAVDSPAELVAVTAAEDFEPGTAIQVRVKEAEHGWSDWTTLNVDHGHGPDPDSDEAGRARPGSDPLMAVAATKVQVRIDTPSGEVPEGVSVALVDAPAAAADQRVSAQAVQAAAAGQPVIISRAQWGANESWRSRAPYYSDEIRAGFIHHTASTSNYSKSQAAAQVRAIYSYHTRSLGHSDIDYNFVVDRYGRLYEGRYGGIDRPVIGGHTAGFNDRTFAAVVLGNYHTWTPPASEMTSIKKTLAKLFAWKLGLYGINPADKVKLLSAGFPRPIRYPKGTWATIYATSSHQTMNYTACPGNYMQAQLSSIRSLASKYAKGSLAPPTPEVASFTSGSRSSVRFSSSSSAAVDWTAEILSPCSDTPVRTYSGNTSGGAFSFKWNLRDSDGDNVLPATYSVRLSASDSDGNETSSGPTTVTMVPSASGSWGPCATASRISGKSPASTSVRMGRETAPDSRTVVLTGRGDAGQSALAAGIAAAPLARSLGAPLLMTAHGKLASSVAANIKDRAATEVIIVGRKRVVSADVADQVAALGVTVTRMGGSSDASVAAKAAARMGPTSSAVLVSPDGSPAHSLAGAALAARRGVPALLVTDAKIPDKTVAALVGKTSVTAVGTTTAIPSKVVRKVLGDRSWNRLVGADQYSEVSASIAVASAFPGSETSAVVLPRVPSYKWRTASVAASTGSPLLFTKKKKLVPEVVAFLRVRDKLAAASSVASAEYMTDDVLGDTHRVLKGQPVAGDTTSSSVVTPPQPTTQYRSTRTNAKPEPVRSGDTLTLRTTVESRFTDGSWRPIPAGAAFVVQFKRTGTTTYQTVGTGYTTNGVATATATATESGKWRIVVGSTKARRDYVEVVP